MKCLPGFSGVMLYILCEIYGLSKVLCEMEVLCEVFVWTE